jgi:hypothetical protein
MAAASPARTTLESFLLRFSGRAGALPLIDRAFLLNCRLPGVSDALPVDARPGSELVRANAGRARNLIHIDTMNQERICNQRTVAAPWHNFRAHDCSTAFAPQMNEFVETFIKLRSLHVIRKAAKACVAPRGVGRVAARMPEAPERRHVTIMNSHRLQRVTQNIFVELRVVSGTWNGSHVNELLYLVSAEQCDELADRPCGVSNGPESDFPHSAPGLFIGKSLDRVQSLVRVLSSAKLHCVSAIP